MNIFMRWKNFTLDEIFPIESKLFFIIVPSHHSSTVRNTETKKSLFLFHFKITVHDFVVVAKLFFLWCFLPSWMMLKIYIFATWLASAFIHALIDKRRDIWYMIYYIWVSLKVFVSLFLFLNFFFSLFLLCLFYGLIPEWITRKWGKERGDEAKRRNR